MSEPVTDPAQVVTEFCAAWGRGDVEAILGAFTPDATYHNIPMDPAIGLDAIKAVIDGFAGMADAITFDIVHQLANGNLVMNERVDTIVMGERTVALPVMGVFEITDEGKIAAWRDYFDLAQFTGG